MILCVFEPPGPVSSCFCVFSGLRAQFPCVFVCFQEPALGPGQKTFIAALFHPVGNRNQHFLRANNALFTKLGALGTGEGK